MLNFPFIKFKRFSFSVVLRRPPTQSSVNEDYVICCIALQEEPYIEEWIDYHLDLGFQRIYIYDNDPKVPLKALLLPKYSGKVEIIAAKGKRIQVEAYDHFFKTYAQQHKFAAIIDCDEFVVIHHERPHIKTLLDRCLSENDAGLCLNWRLFGSSGQQSILPGGVLDRFVRAQKDANHHVKSIVRCKAVRRYGHPHFPVELVEGFDPLKDTHGNTVTSPFNRNGSLELAQINHYFVKSKEEFNHKAKRGKNGPGFRTISEFWSHDFNEIEDRSALVCRTLTSLQRERLVEG